ncbi:5-methyltetrahydropteroyltriglutamate--homocysteine S-methyltransferase [Rummeliibacillus suwonensis]|uniref:5-methyltetrahydropteroyltriglutamate-- homocysteine S-methyltransferase n=1 Tax=Rummeliibacillus suwonensis TaxID=1306154 RepID=UPI00289F7B80|nr:5-methyltetrahydropteroyltriglutamate--homocysteine S-methyltransferase [Rummeliibacillus suwonensis]
MKYTNSVIGYPYIGGNREWKRTVESYWKQEISEHELHERMKQLRLDHLKKQLALGIDQVTIGDFTYYDRMLDTAVMFGLVPKRYQWTAETVDLGTYYAMARGREGQVASEMTKWFNTNYHYIVPEYEGQKLYLTENTILKAYKEAKEELGIEAKPTIIGPYTFSRLTKGYDAKTEPEYILKLIPLYIQVLKQLVEAGAEWIQIEEPSLVTTLDKADIATVKEIYSQIVEEVPNAKILLQTYFESVSFFEEIVNLPVAGIGLDFVHGYKGNMDALRKFGFPKNKVLAAGIINGRDIWRADLAEKYNTLQAIQQLSKCENIWIQSSCSLQHVPVTTAYEKKLAPVLKNALAFADEKIIELKELTSYANNPKDPGNNAISESIKAIQLLREDASRNNETVKAEMASIKEEDFKRSNVFEKRQEIQREALELPLFPTTTIGSFPQSTEVKKTRSAWRKQKISDADYEAFVKEETERWIHIQEDLGLDVLVHGEFERTDMVEYFGEKLDGFAFTENAWVVSYGSRCVKPPIIYGDVAWKEPMTVKSSVYAQSLTKHYVKGMLTGPVTILNWSFVRDDIPRKEIAYQIALALKKEIEALEKAGIAIIQVDEPALREGLPLRKENWSEYLDWGVKAFRLATSSVEDQTQIHTHMCYCEFNDFIEPISALDADVISIETSRSHGELIDSLKETPYDKGIGLGVYDIHSPRVPSIKEMETIMQESLEVLKPTQFWVNPDCGLKTRGETETVSSLQNMVEAAKTLREDVASSVKS